MFGKSYILLLCLSVIFFNVDAQFLEVATAIGKGASYVYKAITTGKALYQKYAGPPELNTTYAYLSLKENLDQIKSKLSDLRTDIPDLTNLKSRIFEIQKAVARIDDHYKNYLEYSDPENNYDDYTIKQFAKDMLNENVGLPAEILNINTNLVGNDQNSLVYLMENYIEDLSPFCSSGLSRQQYFYKLFLSVLATEFKVFVTLDYALNITKISKNVNTDRTRSLIEEKTLERISNSEEVFKEVLKKAGRDIWRCDPAKNEERITYVKLNNLYRWVFYDDRDFMDRRTLKCSGQCPTSDRNNALVAKCHSNNNDCSIKQRVCNNVVECTNLPFKEDYEVCAKKSGNGKRYKTVKFSDSSFTHQLGNLFGFTGCDGNFNLVQTFSQGGNYAYEVCTACKCVCDETNDSDRFFSLKSATSDIKSNYIVTGVQFVKENRTIFIKIQQGKLLPAGFVSNETEWKSIEDNTMHVDHLSKGMKVLKKYRTKTVDKDVVELNWFDRRGVILDDIQLPRDELVTGVRLIVDEQDQDSFLKLDIRSTKFDVETGELLPKTSYWYYTDASEPKRTKLNLGGYDSPILVDEANRPEDEVHQFTYFTPSDLTSNDAGQNVLPFLDVQPVVSNPATPLSGISLVIKKGSRSGGYLIFRIKTYNALWI